MSFACVNRIVLSDVSDDPSFWQDSGDDTENRFPCIYFKVVDIRGPESAHKNFVLDKDQTKLVEVLIIGKFS